MVCGAAVPALERLCEPAAVSKCTRAPAHRLLAQPAVGVPAGSDNQPDVVGVRVVALVLADVHTLLVHLGVQAAGALRLVGCRSSKLKMSLPRHEELESPEGKEKRGGKHQCHDKRRGKMRQ